MSFFEKGAVRIHFEEAGSGFPLLLIAGGGLNSTIAGITGSYPPFNAMEEFKDEHRCIAFDLRNANPGQSSGPLETDRPWDSHTDDQLGLMDHLGIDRFHILGACIGGSFCLKLCELVPQRIMSAVLLQPIGRVPENIDYTRRETAENWGLGMCKTNPTIDLADIIAMGERMFTPEFVHAVTREFVAQCTTQMLLMPGSDLAHPASISDEILRLAPRIEYLKFWRNEGRQYSALVARDFLRRNTPN